MPNEIPTSVRAFINRRDPKCPRCGAPGAELAHRMRRREGGHRKYGIIRLCRACHRWSHANPKQAEAQGYIVSAFSDPEEMVNIPILTRWGWRRLNDQGEWE